MAPFQRLDAPASTRNFSVLAALLLGALCVSACQTRGHEAPSGGGQHEPAAAPPPAKPAAADGVARAQSLVTARKVIRTATLSLEVDSPAAAQTETTRIAEEMGGYVMTSEREISGEAGERRVANVNVTLRVPCAPLVRYEQPSPSDGCPRFAGPVP